MNSKLSGPQLVELKNLVVKYFNASNWRELGALTNMLDQVENHGRLLRSLSWHDDDYDGFALIFLKEMIGPNDENLSIVQNYIFKKCSISSESTPERKVIPSPSIFDLPSGSVDLNLVSGEDISSESTSERKVIFSPSIFDLPSESVDPNLVSVMMPFTLPLLSVYGSIQSAAQQQQLVCKRADDIWDNSTVIQDIFSLIFRSTTVRLIIE